MSGKCVTFRDNANHRQLLSITQQHVHNQNCMIYRPFSSCAKVKYLISSHVNYEKSRNVALATMKHVLDSDKCVVVAGSDTERSVSVNGVEHHFVKQNAYELTGLIHVSMNYECYAEYDYVLLLHDTIVFGANTAELVNSHPFFDFDISFAVFPARTNIGLYRVKFLQEQKSVVMRYDGMTKQRACTIEENLDAESLNKFSKLTTNFLNANFVRKKFGNPYSPTSSRVEAHLQGIDVTKWYKRQGCYGDINLP